MKLYCDPISTTSRPVLLFAAEHGLALEREHVDLMTGQHLSPDYLAINPNGIVPFLVDGDLATGESTAILRYLAARTGSKTYPTDLKARARVDEAMGWFSTHFHEYFCLFTIYPNMGVPHGLDPVVAQGLMAYGEEHCPRWLTVLDRHMIGDRAFVCGDEITLADYLGSAFVTLGELAAFDFSPYPNIQRWIANMKALPGWGVTYAGFNGFVSALRAQAQAAA
jgi:glutathione S-transferase